MKTAKFYLQRLAIVGSVLALTGLVRADDPPPTPEDLEREAAIQKFTQKQIAANYPEKFKKAAEEFGVPAEILMGIAFAETRMEHLTWPEGERYSPDNGMPRPYGIMSLWDNEFFGHSLIEAAKAIGKDPEVLKQDPLENIRGAAALLKKYYQDADKPAYAKENSLESWKYAIVKYCGIEDKEFSHQHAFDVYDWLSQGYDQYGIVLPQVPDLDLKEMWDETKKIKEEERARKEAEWRAKGMMDDAILEEYQTPDGMWHAREVGKVGDSNAAPATATARTSSGPPVKRSQAQPAVATSTPASQNVMVWGALIGVCAVVIGFILFRKKPAAPAPKK